MTGVSPTTAVVRFTEYGNHEEVVLEDLKQRAGRAAPGPGRGDIAPGPGQGDIAPTPGLPPAFTH